MAFDLNLLLTFEAMNQARSVSGAAQLLGLSQPAASAALGRLRKALGDELFTYAGGVMQPTPTARRLAPGLLAALAQLREVLDAERVFEPATARECFTLGVTDYASTVIGPALSVALALEAPGIDLRLQGYDKSAVGTLIETGALDGVIGTFADPPERAVATPLFNERFVGVARTGHPMLQTELDAARFAACDHALFTLARDGRGVVDASLAALGLQRRVRLSLPHLMALPDILRATDLVATVPARAAERFGPGIECFNVAFLNLAPWTLHLLWSPYARKDRARVWFRDLVARVCATV